MTALTALAPAAAAHQYPQSFAGYGEVEVSVPGYNNIPNSSVCCFSSTGFDAKVMFIVGFKYGGGGSYGLVGGFASIGPGAPSESNDETGQAVAAGAAPCDKTFTIYRDTSVSLLNTQDVFPYGVWSSALKFTQLADRAPVGMNFYVPYDGIVTYLSNSPCESYYEGENLCDQPPTTPGVPSGPGYCLWIMNPGDPYTHWPPAVVRILPVHEGHAIRDQYTIVQADTFHEDYSGGPMEFEPDMFGLNGYCDQDSSYCGTVKVFLVLLGQQSPNELVTGQPTNNENTGTATLPVVAGNGKLRIMGNGIRSVATHLRQQRAVGITISPTGSTRALLARKGKATVHITIGFASSHGKPQVQTRTIILQLRK